MPCRFAGLCSGACTTGPQVSTNGTGLTSLYKREAHQSCCLFYLASQLHQQDTTLRSSTSVWLAATSSCQLSACALQLHSNPTKKTLGCQLQSMNYFCEGMPQDHLGCHDLGL